MPEFSIWPLGFYTFVTFVLMFAHVAGESLRTEANRLQHPDRNSQSSSMSTLLQGSETFLKLLAEKPWLAAQNTADEKDQFVLAIETLEALVSEEFMSMPLSFPSSAANAAPSRAPSVFIASTSSVPAASLGPARPTAQTPQFTMTPTETRSRSPTKPTTRPSSPLPLTLNPTENPEMVDPTLAPTTAMIPSQSPTRTPPSNPVPTLFPTEVSKPTKDPTSRPSAGPSSPPSHTLTMHTEPTPNPSDSASKGETSNTPTLLPTIRELTFMPTISPSWRHTSQPTPGTVRPTDAAPSKSPFPCGLSPSERIAGMLAVLDSVVIHPHDLRNASTAQGQATHWILYDDDLLVCPLSDRAHLIQRWVLAVLYFSTNGNDWYQCASPQTDAGRTGKNTKACGTVNPFFGAAPFLSNVSECTWAGIGCTTSTGLVNDIELANNNLVGTIPTELGLLTELKVWAMERGGLRGTIPSQVGTLQQLTLLSLDVNSLTGTLPQELFTLRQLTELDLNNNQLSGSIDGLGGAFPNLEFLQLHNNDFSGTVPALLGTTSTNLTALTLQNTLLSGSMPTSICELVHRGMLVAVSADCAPPYPNIVCHCCTDCLAP